MSEVNVNATPPEPEREVVHVHHPEVDHPTEAGINFIAVLIVLVVLVALVALIFYALPSWLGTNNVNINIRTP